MRVGIPRALLYYYYFPFWKTFFEELNVEVVISDETNKRLINEGIRESVSEICVPIKIFVGHTLNLIKKDVDYIFVPRMVSIAKGEYFCPKFMGLPDLLKNGVSGIEGKLLTCHIFSENDDIYNPDNYLSLAEPLGVTEQEIRAAAKKAQEDWLAARMYTKMGKVFPDVLKIMENKPIEKDKNLKPQYAHYEKPLRIAVMGYVYNIYDDFVSMNLLQKLNDLQVDFITFDMMDEAEIMEPIKDMNKTLFWTFSNKLLGAGYKLLTEHDIDGLIHITAFGCGPDSFLGTLFEMKSDEVGIPFMMIRVDEHTGENHLQTRIEAFIDMLRRKKRVG